MVTIKRRYVYEDVDRWGNIRIYFWRGKGHKKIRMHEKPGTEAFDRRYHELMRQSEAGEFKTSPSTAPIPGTLRWLGVKWLNSSAFRELDPRTQHVTRLILDSIYREPIAPGTKEIFGDCPLSRFSAKSVAILRDRKADHPEGANNRVRRLRAMFRWALKPENRELGITGNPARDVDFLKPKRTGGFPTWSEKDIEQFKARHPIGSKARLAFELLIYTGARRSDVVQLGRQHMRDGCLSWRQHKGRNRTPTIVTVPVLPELQQVLDKSPTGDLTFLVTERGQPFTAAGFTNWFRDRCREAGLVDRSAHGLRKAAATYLAERGASTHVLMAIFGWRTLKQAERYTEAANRRQLALNHGHLLSRTNSAGNFPT
jgi:integrase